jgi:cytoskeletal protein RodZ
MGQLGDTLKERRMALGIPIEQAEDATKIRGKLLLALENGEYDKLPNPGYVRGYISSYSRYLELDSVPLLAMYRAETGSTRFHDIAPADEPVRSRTEQHDVPWRVGVVVVVVLAVLSIGIWMVMRANRGPEKVVPIPTTPGAASGGGAVSPSGEDTASTSPASEPRSTTSAKLTPFTLKITVAPNSVSYIKVTIDGKKAFNANMTSRSKTFQVTKKATIVVGKPSVVDVYRDGKKTAIPNTSGTPTLVLTANPAP